jgi:hypothetical protein
MLIFKPEKGEYCSFHHHHHTQSLHPYYLSLDAFKETWQGSITSGVLRASKPWNILCG